MYIYATQIMTRSYVHVCKTSGKYITIVYVWYVY